MPKTLPPMHPGEVLREEFLAPLNMSPYALSKVIDVPRTRIERICREEVGITADTALRLGKAFGTTARFWMNLQSRYDEQVAERALKAELKFIKPIEMDAPAV